MKPLWCPHIDCIMLMSSQDRICVGKLPKPVLHDKAENTHRWCLEGAADNGGVFDLQVNVGDLFCFDVMFDVIRKDCGRKPLLYDEPEKEP